MPKLIYIDCEVTGFDPTKHGLTHLSAIVEIDGKEVDSINLYINPFTYQRFDVEVEEYNLLRSKRTLDEIKKYPNSYNQFLEFEEFLNKHVPQNDRLETPEGQLLQPVGYNVRHDIAFIQAWIKDNDTMPYSPSYMDYFSFKELDIYALVKFMRTWGLLGDDIQDDKLGTLCEHFDIPLDWHNSESDVRATKELLIELKQLLSAL